MADLSKKEINAPRFIKKKDLINCINKLMNIREENLNESVKIKVDEI